MASEFGLPNVYAGEAYADEYAALDWEGTYYLVRRDLPSILQRHVPSGSALDFGCGTGRSTRLLRDLGYETVGIDVSDAMVDRARQIDPGQDYRVISDGDFSMFEAASFDLILACFPFDNIAGFDRKSELFSGLASLLQPNGCLINIVSSPEIYVNEWASFTTAQFEANRNAQPGEIVQIITTEFAEARVCDDILCDDETYMKLYDVASLGVTASYRPLGLPDEPVAWVSELTVTPWVIWVLHPSR